MIKLLIVDDEKNTREGLRKTIPWKEIGVEEVHEAQNGVEALQVVEDLRPDIILCDVRMPKMDGIEFSHRVKEKYQWCRIIFLSGYSDKEYLKSAIKLGAVDYIEKPIRIAEIKMVIQDTVRQCNEDNSKKAKEQHLQHYVNESKLLLKQELALKLISETTDFDSLSNEYHDIYDFGKTNNGYTVAAVFISGKGCSTDCDTVEMGRSITLWLNAEENSPNFRCLSAFANESVLLAIFDQKIHQTNNSGFNEILLEIIGRVTSKGYKCSIGVGEPVTLLKAIPHSYKSALKAAEKRFFRGYGSILYNNGDFQNKLAVDDSFFTEIDRQLLGNSEDELLKTLDRLSFDVRRNENTDIGYVRNVYVKLYMQVDSVYSKVISNESDNPKNNSWLEILGLDTLDEISEHVKTRLKELFEHFKHMGSDDTKIYEIKKYVNRNYADKELSLKQVSENIHLSLNYMCNLFKQKTGSTVNDYITQVRLEKARELLSGTSIKTYEVSSRVGFENPNYFAKLFKKYYGKTPSESREKLIK